MKPKDLKFPFTWKERKPFLGDQIFFIPDYYDQHHLYGILPWNHIFGNHHPISIEYCSGNGAWIIDKAKDQTKNWIAVEMRFDRARKIWSKIKNLELPNVFVVCGEAEVFTQYYISDQSIAEVYVNYPDPWPKKKHAKNRLFQQSFTDNLHRIIKTNGMVTVVTDDIDYGCQILDTMMMENKWTPVFPKPYFLTDWPTYGHSYFDTLWKEKGRTIHYFQFIAL